MTTFPGRNGAVWGERSKQCWKRWFVCINREARDKGNTSLLLGKHRLLSARDRVCIWKQDARHSLLWLQLPKSDLYCATTDTSEPE